LDRAFQRGCGVSKTGEFQFHGLNLRFGSFVCIPGLNFEGLGWGGRAAALRLAGMGRKWQRPWRNGILPPTSCRDPNRFLAYLQGNPTGKPAQAKYADPAYPIREDGNHGFRTHSYSQRRDLSPLAEKLAALLVGRGTLSVADAAAIRNTIKDKFTELVGNGLAELHGMGRGAHYRPSSVSPKRVTVDAGREAQQNRADMERRKPC
jgi:hypothetical protein